MNQKKLFKIVAAALFAAITCIATYIVIPFPIPNGYVNLGDCFVLLSGLLLGPFYGFLAAGIGSALADVLLTYVQYAPATFIIKGLMAVIVYFIFKALSKKPFIARLIGGIAAESVMVLGYFGYEAVILKYGLPASANILFNAVQGAVGLIVAIIIATVISKNKTLSSFFKR